MHMSFRSLFLLLLSFTNADVMVQTECGTVVGKSDGKGTSAFLGIPFALPPIKERRWKPPVPLKESSSCNASARIAAQVYAEACVQYGGPQASTGQEDCLYLNVWTVLPNGSTTSVANKLPVIVFIYGGDLTQGKTSWYNMSELSANGPVVAVSIAYRLNIFGFFAARELRAGDPRETSGNYGFLDVQEGLRWIQRNIANFGGDPSRVLLSGQSSGGTAILALLASPSSVGLFSSALVLSGSPNISMPVATAEMNSQLIVNGLGCLRDNPVDGLDCLLNLSTSELLQATSCCGLWDENGLSSFPDCDQCFGPGKGLSFLPGLAIVDGVTVVMPLFDALKAKIVDVPLIIQTNAQEPDLGPAEYDSNLTISQFTQRLDVAFAAYKNVSSSDLLKLYSEDMAIGGPQKVYESIVSDMREVCGNLFAAQTAAKHFSSNVFFTLVTAAPSHPVYIYDAFWPTLFSGHFVDLLAWFGTLGGSVEAGCCPGGSWFDCSPAPRCNTEKAWGGPFFQEQASDKQFTVVLQRAFYEFAVSGNVAGWINATIGGQNLTTQAAVPTPKLKDDICAFWQNKGFGPWEWWAD